MAREGFVNVRVGVDELERLDRLVAERGSTRSGVVREALRSFLDTPAPATGDMDADELLGLVAQRARAGEKWALELMARRLLVPPATDPDEALAIDFAAALERREARG